MAGYLAEQLQRGLDDLFVPRFTSRRIASPKPGGTNIAWNLWKTHPTFQQQPLPVNLTSVPEELFDIGHAGRTLPFDLGRRRGAAACRSRAVAFDLG